MKCKLCNQPLLIGKSELVTELDSLDINSKMTMVCNNPKCPNYAGEDLSNPLAIAETITRKV